VIGNSLLLGDDGGYNLTRSLRFRSSASAYLSRTPTVAGSGTTWTFSCWVKRGAFSTSSYLPIYSSAAAAYNVWFGFGNISNSGGGYSGDYLFFNAGNGSTQTAFQTLAVYRDPAAWYHIVLKYDSSNATAANRVNLYVNGVLQSWDSSTTVSQNYTTDFNTANQKTLSSNKTIAGTFFDGYLAEVNFIDGQALTPSSFGAYSIYNQWLPKKYAGTYGTNGFYLPFTNNASTTTLGYDFSPQGNNWTTNNISVTAGSTYDSMTDVPTLTSATAANYCTLNPINPSTPANPMVYSNGNLQATSPVGNLAIRTNPTMYVNSGKFYCEMYFSSGYSTADGTLMAGFIASTATNRDPTNNGLSYENTGAIGYLNNGAIYVNGSVYSASGTYSTFTLNDVIMLAIDMDTQKVYVGKNGTWQNSGSPSAGTGYVYNAGILASGLWGFSATGYGNGGPSVMQFTFGQRPFSYTPPSGFVALNTYNL